MVSAILSQKFIFPICVKDQTPVIFWNYFNKPEPMGDFIF